jgi:2-(1,2-epoxy-1,2-dihydrophenyl)acetyl-CoA isomerase
MSNSCENVNIQYTDSAAFVTLDGSGPMNTLDKETLSDLLKTAVNLAEDDDVRCIAITGEGDAFSAGANLTEFDGNSGDEAEMRRFASLLHDAIVQLHQADKPVVTGVNGTAAGSGFGLALTGDIILVSEDAKFEYAYPRVGLTGDGGSTFFLPRLVGLRRAKEILLYDEPISPQEAVDIGIATETVPAEDFEKRLQEVAAQLASGPTKAFGATKQLMTESFSRDISAQLAAETDAMGEATHGEDYARGHTAFFEGESPEFTGQ